MLLSSQRKQLYKKVWELYLLHPISLASRIANGTDKTIAHTIRQYLKVYIVHEDWIYL